MIQSFTRLAVADNSGAKRINVYQGFRGSKEDTLP